MEFTAANVASDNFWDKWRTKHVSFYQHGNERNTHLLLIEHSCNSEKTQVIHESSATFTAEIMLTTFHPLHVTELIFTSKRLNINGSPDLLFCTILVWRWRLCQSYGFFTTPYSIRRRRDGSNLHWHQKRQKTKTLRLRAKHIECTSLN